MSVTVQHIAGGLFSGPLDGNDPSAVYLTDETSRSPLKINSIYWDNVLWLTHIMRCIYHNSGSFYRG